MDERIRLFRIAILFVVYLVLAAILPAVDDEVYYWCWAKELQWSYYDHPPMTAVLIWLSTSLFGDSVLGFRIPACIGSAFVVYVISRLTPFKPFVWAVVFSPLFTIGAVLITPDSPLVMFWAAYLWWLVDLHQRLTPEPDAGTLKSAPLATANEAGADNVSPVTAATQEPIATNGSPARHGPSWGNWLIGGVILGCGVLSKYTMGLAVPTAFISLLLARRPWKEWLPGYVFHGVVAFVVASPILIYNIGQHFEPLLYQWQHVAEKPSSALLSLGDFVGVQMLLFGTMPFFLLPWVFYHFPALSRNPRLRVCACLYALPLAFFLYKSTQSRLQGNWALICFISFWPVASEWYQSVRGSKAWRWSTAAAFLPPVLAVLAVTVHLIWPIPLVPIRGDRVYRQIALNEATRVVADEIRKLGEPLPVYADSYQMTSLLRFQSLGVNQIDGLTRPSHFTRPPRRLTDVNRAYVVTENPLPPEFCKGFPPPELVATVPVDYRGVTDRTFRVWRYSR